MTPCFGFFGEQVDYLCRSAGRPGQRYEKLFFTIAKKSATTFLGILMAGLVFTRIINIGITKPILPVIRLKKDGLQNWKSPAPVKGFGKTIRLGRRFDQIAQTLIEREASLSRDNVIV